MVSRHLGHWQSTLLEGTTVACFWALSPCHALQQQSGATCWDGNIGGHTALCSHEATKYCAMGFPLGSSNRVVSLGVATGWCVLLSCCLHEPHSTPARQATHNITKQNNTTQSFLA